MFEVFSKELFLQGISKKTLQFDILNARPLPTNSIDELY